MIIKIERGDSAEGLLRYLRRSDRLAEEQANVRIFDLHRITHIENAAARLDRAAARSGLSKPIVHIIIRAERALTDPEKKIAIAAVRTELGMAAHPGVAVVHDPDQDTGQTAFLEETRTEHLHLQSCAANDAGETPPRILYSRLLERAVTPGEAKYLPKGDVRSRSWDSYSQRRLMAVARTLEDQFGLQPLARNRQEQAEEKGETVKVSAEAQARWKRDGSVPLLHRIDITAAKAALELPAWDKKVTALAQLDLNLEPIFAKNGQLRGLRLVARDDPSVYCAASDLGSNYGRAALDKRSDRPFVDWYAASGRSPAAAQPTARRKAAPAGPEAEYQAYVRQHAAEREILREADADLRAWRRRQRDAALARKEARWPQQRHRTARPLRAEILQAYRAECAGIEREYERQRDVLTQRRTRKLTYQEWLTTQTSPAAAERLQLLSRRSVPGDAKAPTDTMPSGAALAAAAEEQAMRRRAAEEIAAELQRLAAARDRQRDLADRLGALGVALVSKADADNRQVAVEDRAVRIDGRALHTAASGADDPVLQAGTEMSESQRVEIQTLPLMIKAALGLPPRQGETPRLWLDRLFHQPQVTRWLDKEQIAAVQQRWDKDAEEARAPADDLRRIAGTPSAEQRSHEQHPHGEAAPPAYPPVAPVASSPSTSGVGADRAVPTPASYAPAPAQQQTTANTGKPQRPMPASNTRSPQPPAVADRGGSVTTSTVRQPSPAAYVRPVPAQPPAPVTIGMARAPEVAPMQEPPASPPIPSVPESDRPARTAPVQQARPSGENGASLVATWLALQAAAAENAAENPARDAAAAAVLRNEQAREVAAMLDDALHDAVRRQAREHHAREERDLARTAPKAPRTETAPAQEPESAPAPADRKQQVLRQHVARQLGKGPRLR